MDISIESQLTHAAGIVKHADTVIILAGAGMSAEVGIPTYWVGADATYGGEKSEQGYTALQHGDASLWIQDTGAQIEYFTKKQEAFASIDFSASIYRTLLNAVADKDYFCVTSNVDSGFIRAGFDSERLFEIHGSYRNCQCIMDPIHGIFESVDDGNLACPVCAMPTRPNALFFNDSFFNPESMFKQQDRFNRFLEIKEDTPGNIAIVEFGVGSTIPRVRQIGNRLYRDLKCADFIHVNLEPEPEFLFGESCNFENKEQWLQMGASAFIEAL